MLKAVRQFLTDISGRDEQKPEPLADDRLAAAALLVHISAIDGHVSIDEGRTLRELLQQRFDLGKGETEELIAKAEEADAEAVDLYNFTSVLKDRLNDEERARIVGMMWDMVFADGDVHEFEDNLVWRVAELLGVSSRERMLLKREAKARYDKADDE